MSKYVGLATAISAMLVAGLAAVYFVSPSFFIQLADPKGYVVQHLAGALAWFIVQTIITRFILQRELRKAQTDADETATHAIAADAEYIIRSYAEVQEDYSDKAVPRLLAIPERAKQFVGRRQSATKGIASLTWDTFVAALSAPGTQARLQFLAALLPPEKVPPISDYLAARANLGTALSAAVSERHFGELLTALFSKTSEVRITDDTENLHLKAGDVLRYFAQFLDTMDQLGLRPARCDEVKQQVDFALARVDHAFGPPQAAV